MSSTSEPGWSSSSSFAEAATSACSWLSSASATLALSFSLSAFLSFLSFLDLWTPSDSLRFFSFLSFFESLDFILTSSSVAIAAAGVRNL